MNTLNIALYSKLIGDVIAGGVNTLATGGIHQRKAPQGAGFPRVEFRELLDTALYSLQTLIGDHVYYQIKGLAVDGNEEGATVAGAISERVRVLLTDPSLIISGKTLLYCRFERTIPDYEEWDDIHSRYIYHDGGIYELWLA